MSAVGDLAAHCPWGGRAGQVGDTTNAGRGAADAGYSRPLCQTRATAPNHVRHVTAPATTAPRSTTARGAREHADVRARVGGVDDEVRATRPRRARRHRASARVRQLAAATTSRGRDARRGPARRPRRRSARARSCRPRRCRRAAGTPGVVQVAHVLVPARVQARACARRTPGTGRRLGGDRLELRDLEQRRGDRDPRGGDRGRSGRAVAPGARARGSRRRRRAARRAPRSANVCAVTRAPAACAAATASASTSAGHSGRRSPSAPRSRSIQSATSLTQPSPRAASSRDRGRQVRRRRRARGRSAAGSAWGGRGAGRRGSAAAGRRASCTQRGVGGRAGVADEQHARRRGRRAPAARRSPSSTAPSGAEPDVAVHVDEPGQHPALEHVRPAPAPAAALERDPAVDDPRLADLALVVEDDRAAQVQDARAAQRRRGSGPGRRAARASAGASRLGLRRRCRTRSPAGAGAACWRSTPRSCSARLAGLPDLPLTLRAGGAVRPRDFLPPMPGRLPMPGACRACRRPWPSASSSSARRRTARAAG